MVPFILTIIITKIVTKNITKFRIMVEKCTPRKNLCQILHPHSKIFKIFTVSSVLILENILKTNFPDYKVDHF